MFCRKCGEQVPEGKRFCSSCGTPVEAPSAAGPRPDDVGRGRTGTSAFFSSPAGIALIVVVSALVIAGIVVGVVFAVKGSGDSNQDQIVKIWEEYEEAVEDAGSGFTTISLDSAALDRARAELAKAQAKAEALQDVVRATKVPTDSTWKARYEALAGSIDYYNRYIKRLEDLYGTLAGGAIADNIDRIKADLEALISLAGKAKDLADDFLKGNTAVAGGEFDPVILVTPVAIGTKVDEVTGGATTTSGDESGPVDTSLADARAVLEEALNKYMTGGWQAITGYMTPGLLSAYNNAPVSWDQVSYTVTGYDVAAVKKTGSDTIVYTVVERRDDFGEVFDEAIEWEMKKVGGAWKVNDATDRYGESKLD